MGKHSKGFGVNGVAAVIVRSPRTDVLSDTGVGGIDEFTPQSELVEARLPKSRYFEPTLTRMFAHTAYSDGQPATTATFAHTDYSKE